jgi:hypothetical protein|uniref:Uncharacterized protein n=1 Tax=Fadolivirus 2 TaxID=2740747 RepID=A0A7D3QVB8_9VIRU|nr:hypothetical protein Fadolivirus_2_19 [Fadolivirus 2]
MTTLTLDFTKQVTKNFPVDTNDILELTGIVKKCLPKSNNNEQYGYSFAFGSNVSLTKIVPSADPNVSDLDNMRTLRIRLPERQVYHKSMCGTISIDAISIPADFELNLTMYVAPQPANATAPLIFKPTQQKLKYTFNGTTGLLHKNLNLSQQGDYQGPLNVGTSASAAWVITSNYKIKIVSDDCNHKHMSPNVAYLRCPGINIQLANCLSRNWLDYYPELKCQPVV